MTPGLLIDWSLRAAALATGPARLTIVTWHRVLPAADPLLAGEPDAALFRTQVEFLARHMRVLPLAEAVSRLFTGTLPRRAVCITFDDGYANNHSVALPVLRDLGVPATFFVATGYLDGGCMWNDAIIEAVRGCAGPGLDLRALELGRHELGGIPARLKAIDALISQLRYRPLAERTAIVAQIAAEAGVDLPRDLMMTSDEVRSLHRQGMEIGGHTIHHPILTRIGEAEARHEIAGGLAAVAAITGEPPRSFAYPNGRPGEDFGPEHAQMAREAGFTCALTTARGCADGAADPFLLPRVTLWSRSPERLTANLVSIYARRGAA